MALVIVDLIKVHRINLGSVADMTKDMNGDDKILMEVEDMDFAHQLMVVRGLRPPMPVGVPPGEFLFLVFWVLVFAAILIKVLMTFVWMVGIFKMYV